MRRHGLRVLERAARFKISSDARGAERVATDLASCAEIGGAALNHTLGVNGVHRLIRQRTGAASGRAEEGALPPSRIPASSFELRPDWFVFFVKETET